MKTLNKTIYTATTILLGLMMVASCGKEEVLPTNNEAASGEFVQQRKIVNYFNDRSSCPEDLVQDAGQCYYVSGDGRDMNNKNEMVDMLNNCHTETPPSNCGWAQGNVTTTEIIGVGLNNCCSPYNSLNAKINGWKAAAENNRPSSSYLIVGYEALGGYMQTTYGPYIFNIKVTYRRKKNCYTQVAVKR